MLLGILDTIASKLSHTIRYNNNNCNHLQANYPESKMSLFDTDYFKAVEFFARSGEPTKFLNKGPEHALSVLINIFRYSQESVFLFSSNFLPDVTNNEDYAFEIKKAAERGLKIYCLTITEVDEKKSDITAVYKVISQLSKNNANVKLKKASNIFLDKVNQYFGTKINFALGDNDFYRLETEINHFTASIFFHNNDKIEEIKKLKSLVLEEFGEN